MEETSVRLAELEARQRLDGRRIDKLQSQLEDYGQVVSSIQVLANEQGHIKDDVSEIKRDVKGLTEKPAKRWESLTATVLSLVTGAILALVFTRLGIG